MGLTFVDGAYNLAAGTRNAFGALSDELVREGHPAMVSLSGDREYTDEIRIWNQRMTLSPGRRKTYGYRWWNGQKWWQIHPDTVAIPGTSNHGKRRSNDLKWPYNSDTAAARRARQLAPKHNISREGENFRELWHWTHWGSLGQIGTPAPSGSESTPPPIGEDPMYIRALSAGQWARAGVIYTNDVGGHWRGMSNLEGNGYVIPLAREGRIRIVDFDGPDVDLLFALNGVWEQRTIDSASAPRWGAAPGVPLIGLGVMTGRILYPGQPEGWQYPIAQTPPDAQVATIDDEPQ